MSHKHSNIKVKFVYIIKYFKDCLYYCWFWGLIYRYISSINLKNYYWALDRWQNVTQNPQQQQAKIASENSSTLSSNENIILRM